MMAAAKAKDTMKDQATTRGTSNRQNQQSSTQGTTSKKNVDNTVFVRFVPPSNSIRRHHVEELFSNCGPIKKSSIIHTAANDSTTDITNDMTSPPAAATNTNTTSSYGFVKYTTPEDAELAASQLHNRTLTIDNVTVTVKVELAKKQIIDNKTNSNDIKNNNPRLGSKNKNRYDSNQDSNTNVLQPPTLNYVNDARPVVVEVATATATLPPSQNTANIDIKKTNRLIVRNLSFYAKEADIRTALQTFGNILDVHIPKVVISKQQQQQQQQLPRGTAPNIKPTHRGFAFVTFEDEKDAEQCLQQKTNSIMIKERAVQISKSLHKTAYDAMQQQQSQSPTKNGNKQPTKSKTEDNAMDEENGTDEDNEESDDEEDGENDEESEDDKEEDGDDDEEDEDGNNDESSSRKTKQMNVKDDTAIAEGRCLFVRNLPFDCTRHDIFDTFRIFGYVTSIFIVKTETSQNSTMSGGTKTLLPKGTAFVTYQKSENAKKALECSNTATEAITNFVSQRTATNVLSDTIHLDSGNNGIIMKGRRLLVDVALDKETASTLIGGEKSADKIGYKDRRNLYLKNEGRVDNNEAKNIMTWDELPEGDKLKRQTAWSEKNTKLRSPLFYINPNRLSIRNLGKHIDEVALKKLIVVAIRRGLYENKLVQPDDQIAHWRASGEYTTREILAKIQEGETSGNGIIPLFDEKNIKQSIPSLHIHRDVVTGGNKNVAPSRGFGFIEFQHHSHALACLRELNNNPVYSKEYAIGGRHVALMKERRNRNSNNGKKRKIDPTADVDEAKINDDNFVTADGNIRTPRLIVEYTVENKAKAKQQAEQKAKQQANQIKQRMDSKSVDDATTGSAPPQEKERKSRGAIQREKKRQRQHQLKEGTDEDKHENITSNADGNASGVTVDSSLVPSSSSNKKKAKVVAPPKKQAKLDAEEVTFSNLVASYQQQATTAVSSVTTSANSSNKATTDNNSSKPKRRWYE